MNTVVLYLFMWMWKIGLWCLFWFHPNHNTSNKAIKTFLFLKTTMSNFLYNGSLVPSNLIFGPITVKNHDIKIFLFAFLFFHSCKYFNLPIFYLNPFSAWNQRLFRVDASDILMACVNLRAHSEETFRRTFRGTFTFFWPLLYLLYESNIGGTFTYKLTVKLFVSECGWSGGHWGTFKSS